MDILKDPSGKKILVIGAGLSGRAASRFLADRGALVLLNDSGKPVIQEDELALLAAAGVKLCFGEDPVVHRDSFDLVVVSPGVPLAVKPLQAARRYGIPVIGEMELSYRFAMAPFVAITGTNGKTTTTALVGAIFEEAGWPTLVGGNIGVPLIGLVEGFIDTGVIVAEVSSFQLESIDLFKPKVAVVLNVSPDHLDRHGDMETYTGAKARIFANQGPEDFVILNYDDPLTRAMGDKSRGRVIFFSRIEELPEGVFVRDGSVLVKLGTVEHRICLTSSLTLPGAHNLENVLAAVAVARVMGVPVSSMASTLTSFKGVPHRLEFVAEINGARYINDSKGTNPDATIKALEAYAGPIVLIAGGKNKGSDFSHLAEYLQGKVRVLVVLGESAGQIAAAARAKNFNNVLEAVDYPEAVRLAHRNALAGDIVLLSPACASWDMFRSFEIRGDLFKKLVRELQNDFQ